MLPAGEMSRPMKPTAELREIGLRIRGLRGAVQQEDIAMQ